MNKIKKIMDTFENEVRTGVLRIKLSKREVLDGYVQGFIDEGIVKHFDLFSANKGVELELLKLNGKPAGRKIILFEKRVA